MNMLQIEAFYLTAQHNSITKAAAQLKVNRTKLSMAIKALEKELKAELFIRAGNHLHLSEVGKTIYKDCEDIILTLERIKKTCQQTSNLFNAELWIARDDSIPDEKWQEFAHTLNSNFPATSFNIILASTGDLANLVQTQQVDYAFGVDYERLDDPRVVYHPLGKIRMMSVCQSEHPLSKRHRVTDNELRHSMQAVMVYLNEKENADLQPFSAKYIGFSSFDYMLNTILTEHAWGVLPEPLIRHYLRKQKLSVIKHTYGLTQEDYCMFIGTGINEHPGMTWLADQLTDYLFDF